MTDVPSLEGLSWAKIRSLARESAASAPVDDTVNLGLSLLAASDPPHRMFGVYLLGATSGARPANLAVLRQRVAKDPSWEVQEALAQAFDAYCAAVGYDLALPTIDAWLVDSHPNIRRAASEGLRPWTARSRAYFAANPHEAVRRLGALRADPSEYVRHSAGNALRDIRRAHPALVDDHVAEWDLTDPLVHFTYLRVQRAR
jgi:hypothetical protein